MSCRTYSLPGAILLLLLVLVLPVNAYTVAIYGTNAGFNPDLHSDTVTVVRQVPGSAGSDLDAAIDDFTQSSVDVMIIAGEDTFTPTTAAKLEEAVAQGKILVVVYPANRLFSTILPADNGGSGPAGKMLDITDRDTALSKEVFAGLPKRYPLLTPASPDKEQAVAKSSATTVMNDESGMPILLFWKYGKGMVIEWTTKPVPSYLSEAEADTILHRLISREKPVVTAIPTTVPVTTTMTPEPVVTTPAAPLPSATGNPLSTGDLRVYSSPLGASILIDGRYYGVTPANLTGITPGNHIIRLALSGYHDYEGTVSVSPGQTNDAFGLLQPLSQYSAAPTAVPIIMPAATAVPTTTDAQSRGLLENSSVIVALIGVITASIAAGATVFTHWSKVKKEGKE